MTTSSTQLHLITRVMSPSSTGDSSLATPNVSARQYGVPSRDNFSVDITSATLAALPNGVSSGIRSPTNIKSQRTPSFSREGVMGGASQKPRHLSQSSDNLNTNGVPPNPPSDEGSNPLKRRNTDVGVDYPRRRATIAVCIFHVIPVARAFPNMVL
jgi:hypothetical protein